MAVSVSRTVVDVRAVLAVLVGRDGDGDELDGAAGRGVEDGGIIVGHRAGIEEGLTFIISYTWILFLRYPLNCDV